MARNSGANCGIEAFVANIVRQWLSKHHCPRSGRGEHIRKPLPMPASPWHVAWLMLTVPDSAFCFLEEIYRECPSIAATARVVREFVRIVRGSRSISMVRLATSCTQYSAC